MWLCWGLIYPTYKKALHVMRIHLPHSYPFFPTQPSPFSSLIKVSLLFFLFFKWKSKLLHFCFYLVFFYSSTWVDKRHFMRWWTLLYTKYFFSKYRFEFWIKICYYIKYFFINYDIKYYFLNFDLHIYVIQCVFISDSDLRLNW